MKFIEEKLEKAFAELLGQKGFRRIAIEFGSTFVFFADITKTIRAWHELQHRLWD